MKMTKYLLCFRVTCFGLGDTEVKEQNKNSSLHEADIYSSTCVHTRTHTLHITLWVNAMKNTKAEERDRRCWGCFSFWEGHQVRGPRELTFTQRLKEGEEENHVGIQGKTIPSKGNSQDNIPDVGWARLVPGIMRKPEWLECSEQGERK